MVDEFIALLVLFAVSLTVNVSLGITWFRASRRIKQLEDGKAHRLQPRPADERTERLEQIVEGLAAQVDQMASSQEFMNRLLTSKPGKVWSAEPERAREVTPH